MSISHIGYSSHFKAYVSLGTKILSPEDLSKLGYERLSFEEANSFFQKLDEERRKTKKIAFFFKVGEININSRLYDSVLLENQNIISCFFRPSSTTDQLTAVVKQAEPKPFRFGLFKDPYTHQVYIHFDKKTLSDKAKFDYDSHVEKLALEKGWDLKTVNRGLFTIEEFVELFHTYYGHPFDFARFDENQFILNAKQKYQNVLPAESIEVQTQIEVIEKNRAFHACSKYESEKYLRDTQVGTFLLRKSETQHGYVLSCVNKESEIEHITFEVMKEGFLYDQKKFNFLQADSDLFAKDRSDWNLVHKNEGLLDHLYRHGIITVPFKAQP